MKKLALIVPFTFALAACGTPSVDELVKDQKLFEKTTEECMKLESKGKSIENNEKCKNLAEATIKKATKSASDLMKQLGQ